MGIPANCRCAPWPETSCHFFRTHPSEVVPRADRGGRNSSRTEAHRRSKQIADLPGRESGVADDSPIVCASTGSCLGMVRIRAPSVMTNVLALPGNQEAGLFECLNRAEMRDSGYLRHALCRNFHFPQVPLPGHLLRHLQVILNGVPNTRQRFLFCGALRPTAGKSRTGDAVSFFRPRQGNRILHTVQFSTSASGRCLPVDARAT